MGSAALLAVWWLVAHNGGSGWVQVIGDALAAVVAVGLLGPAVALARAKIEIHTSPTDAQAGNEVELSVTASSRISLRPVWPPGPQVFAGPIRRPPSSAGRIRRPPSGPIRRPPSRDDAAPPPASPPAPVDRLAVTPPAPVDRLAAPVDRLAAPVDRLTVTPPRRGVYAEVTVEVATAAPFALLWWRRVVRTPLPRPIVVAPRMGNPVPSSWDRPDDRSGETRQRVRSPSAGEPRGVRAYQPGDSRRLLHWPLTAHTGRLMVRETEAPAAEPVTVTVTLPTDPDAAERIAESAFGTVAALLDRGLAVKLVTTQPEGSRTALVEDITAAGRRLARAVANGAGGGGAGVTVS